MHNLIDPIDLIDDRTVYRFLGESTRAKSWSEDEIWSMGLDPSSAEVKTQRPSSNLKPPDEPWKAKVERRWGRLLYSYFNWRQVHT